MRYSFQYRAFEMQTLTWTDDRLDALSQQMESGFAEAGRRFDQIDLRLDQTDRRLDQIDLRLEQTDRRLDQIDLKLERVDVRFDGIDQRFDTVDQRFEVVDQRVDAVDQRLADVGSIKARLDGLDASFRQLAITQVWGPWGVVAALVGLIGAILIRGAA